MNTLGKLQSVQGMVPIKTKNKTTNLGRTFYDRKNVLWLGSQSLQRNFLNLTLNRTEQGDSMTSVS